MNPRLLVLCLSLSVAGCAASSSSDDGIGGSTDDMTGDEGADGIVYFHGMSRLGFSRAGLGSAVGSLGLFAPSLSDNDLKGFPAGNVSAFLRGRPSGVVAGYSLGRVPVLRMMREEAEGMTRAVLIDPTFDNTNGVKGIAGEIGRTWLDGDTKRTLFLVYGDVTKQLGGERSYVEQLGQHARADLCFIPGDHERFRKPDMARALVAENCADLRARLDP